MPLAVIAITGASGAQYGKRLLEEMLVAGWDIDLIITRAGSINLDLECGLKPEDLISEGRVTLNDNKNLAARPASGSAKYDCSPKGNSGCDCTP